MEEVIYTRVLIFHETELIHILIHFKLSNKNCHFCHCFQFLRTKVPYLLKLSYLHCLIYFNVYLYAIYNKHFQGFVSLCASISVYVDLSLCMFI